MPYDFDTIIDRTNTGSLKWEPYADRDMLPMWVADMDFAAPPAVQQALQERVEHGVYGYTLVNQELCEVVIERLKTRHNWQIQPEWLVWLPDLVCGINVCCRAYAEEGESVLTTTPIYPPFLDSPRAQNRGVVRASMETDGTRWWLDTEALESAITEDTRLFLFCNPHNPTGVVHSREELLAIAEICQRHNVVICSDEIHCDLVLDEEAQHISIASLSKEIEANTVTLLSASKTFNLAGLGCSLAVIPDAGLRRKLKLAKRGVVPHLNLFGMTATLAAYRDCQDWLAALLAYLRENRALVRKTIDSIPGLATTESAATYLTWIDCRALKLDDPYAFFKEHGIVLSDGACFGLPGYVRLNYACPRSLLEDGLERIRKAVS